MRRTGAAPDHHLASGPAAAPPHQGDAARCRGGGRRRPGNGRGRGGNKSRPARSPSASSSHSSPPVPGCIEVLEAHPALTKIWPATLENLSGRWGRELPATSEDKALAEPLTKRELSVLSYLTTTMTMAEIAAELHVSTNTVKTHVAATYRKLEVQNRREAIARGRNSTSSSDPPPAGLRPLGTLVMVGQRHRPVAGKTWPGTMLGPPGKPNAWPGTSTSNTPTSASPHLSRPRSTDRPAGDPYLRPRSALSSPIRSQPAPSDVAIGHTARRLLRLGGGTNDGRSSPCRAAASRLPRSCAAPLRAAARRIGAANHPGSRGNSCPPDEVGRSRIADRRRGSRLRVDGAGNQAWLGA